MAARRPLVSIAGRLKQLPVGDTLSWTWLSSIPANITSWASIDPTDKWDTSAATYAGLNDVSSANVATAGELLGGNSRFFSTAGTDTPGGSGIAMSGIHVSRSSGAAFQLIARLSTGTDYGKLWARVSNSSTWAAWRQVFCEGDSQIGLGAAPLLVYDTGSNAVGIRAGASGAYRYHRFDSNGFLYTLNGGVVTAGQIQPSTDNNRTCGVPSERWSVVHAGTGTINTSDARDKTGFRPLTEAEVAAANELSAEIGLYQWIESVQAKGEDARWHVGLTVQRAIEIMESHGLEPLTYAFICYDQWEEQPEVRELAPGEEEGSTVEVIVREYRPAGDRYSFRHDQLLLFVTRGAKAERDTLKARLDALEARL